MSTLEVSKLVGKEGHQRSLTLKRNNSTGYFLLRPFLSLLQKYNIENGNGQGSSDGVSSTEVSAKEEDNLLSQFGILVDTDEEGNKWITGDKATELLRLLNVYHLFESDFGSQQITKEETENVQEKRDGQTPIHASNNVEPNQTADNQNVKMEPHDPGNFSHTVANSTMDDNHPITVAKRHNTDIHNAISKELGSPLKKMKSNNFSTQIDVPKSFGNIRNRVASHDHSEKKIRTYSHDLHEDILRQPLIIQKAHSAPPISDNNQRIKLETFLQRLLFPAIQDVSSNNSSQPLSFQSALQEVDGTYPNIPLNLNIPVDERGNTPLHWLASIANLELVKYLVENGANRFIGDNAGESALVKAVKSVNNYDSGTFEELLDLLYPCLILEDTMNRSILHHIVITSGMPGCSAAAKYYLDILMGWIVKKQSRELEGAGADLIFGTLDLKWIISNMLNAPDSNGDTCLNIASRLGNVAIVDALLDYGADPYVANKSGLRPADFGAGTSKLHTNGGPNGENSDDKQKLPIESTQIVNVPDTLSLVGGMQSLLDTVSKDYTNEVKEHQEKLNKLHKELNSHREILAASRDRLANAKQLQDEHAVLKEQLQNIKQGIIEEEQKFKEESKQLGLSAEDTAGADWDSSEFDADEPFRIDFIYDILEGKLVNQYNGSIEKLLESENFDSILNEVRSVYSSQYQDNEKLENILPPSVLLKARIKAYERNDEHLDTTLKEIRKKQEDLESKFRRVLCLCLKIDEDKVDGMLDGLLQAISSEDSQDVDTDEMQEFLNKHNA